MKMKAFLLLLAMMCVLGATCFAERSPINQNAVPLPQERMALGGIHVGDTMEIVKSILGDPDSKDYGYSQMAEKKVATWAYGNSASTSFVTATSDTLEITKAALRCLESIYVPGIMYKRSGVMVGDIVPSNPLQLDLFDTNKKRMERNKLMRVLDCVNQRYGVKTLHLAVEDTPISYGAFGGGWHVKCEHRSPNYLTDINEILTIKI